MVPDAVAVDPTTNRLFVANYGDSTVSVFDGDTDRQLASVQVGMGPRAICVSPRTHRVYVVDSSDAAISVLDGEALALRATIPVGGYPMGATVDPLTDRLYVVHGSDGALSGLGGLHGSEDMRSKLGGVTVVDGPSATVYLSLRLDTDPVGIGVDPSTSRLYVSDFTGNSICILQDEP